MGRKTDPKHKAQFVFGVQCSCSCGWKSAVVFGKGAKSDVAAQWQYHRKICDGRAENVS